MERFQLLSGKGQTSFEFIMVLTLMIMLIGVFTLSIAEEYTDTFVLSAVKSTVEHEIAYLSLSNPACSGTYLEQMDFSKSDNLINIYVSGCPINVSKVAGKVETQICGASAPHGDNTVHCSGEIYMIQEM